MVPEIHVADIGTVFKATMYDRVTDANGVVTSTILNVANAGVRQLLFRKPSGVLLTKPAALFTDGTDGVIQYVTIAGDLDLAGSWDIQGYVEVDGGKWHSDVLSRIVHPNLN